MVGWGWGAGGIDMAGRGWIVGGEGAGMAERRGGRRMRGRVCFGMGWVVGDDSD